MATTIVIVMTIAMVMATVMAMAMATIDLTANPRNAATL